MPGGTNRSGSRDLGNAVRNHWQRIEDAIRTGSMANVKRANRVGYNEERREIKEYAGMK
jgi:hypothetical protein